MAILITALILSAIFGAYVFSLRSRGDRKDKMQPFRDVMIAHRGYFNNKDIPENSLSAFKKAVDAGFGIELDVQQTRDGSLVVFHDESLLRMCGDPRLLREVNFEELRNIPLLGTNERIPLFEDVLAVIGGKAPVIVEIKKEGDFIGTCEKTKIALSGYKGVYCIESFSPFAVKWWRRNAPEVICGILVNNFMPRRDIPFPVRFLLTNLMFCHICVPDFIACEKTCKNLFSYRLCRFLYRPSNVAWTIRSEKELIEAQDVFEVFIFDSFTPALRKNF